MSYFYVVWYQLKYITNVLAVCKTACYMCICSYNHFGTNPVHLIICNVAELSQMKCCGAVSNEMSFSEITKLSFGRKRMNSFGRTNRFPNSQHKFVFNGAGVINCIYSGLLIHELNLNKCLKNTVTLLGSLM